MTTTHYDAIVVGARCAGAATAMLLARQGARVLLVDSAPPGTDTMSTHALMRGAVMLLERWGLAEPLRAAGTPQVSRTSFIYGAAALDLDIRPEEGVETLMAPRRYCLTRCSPARPPRPGPSCVTRPPASACCGTMPAGSVAQGLRPVTAAPKRSAPRW
ncbi:FAD-binding monooxygenase [Citreicella sp. SE45]|nr:FAD-binding monooxygenase [Citreicella sp. SE45]